MSRLLRRLAALCAGAVPLALSACPADSLVELRVGPATFRVEVAATPAARQQGLMFREELGLREGMLFVFDRTEVRSFWMRNTPLPLSIAYIDERGVIVHITDMEPYSEAPVSSRFPARYALEVNRGAFADAGVRVGDRVEIPAQYR